MKQATYTFYELPVVQDSFPGTVKHSLAKAFNILPTWYRRKVDRIRLAELSPDLRLDAGMTEAQWRNEVTKPFWEE
jgi:uncharacterized protein YjiS (DUF1127 family)